MNLHHASSKPDWMLTPPDKRNVWQRLAYRTRGILTPANLVSLLGAVLVVAGLILLLDKQILEGLLLIGIGRFADAADGVVANRTGTKSRVGALIDAGLDKIVAFAALTILVVIHIVPLWLAVLIAAQNAANVIITLIGGAYGTIVQPSRAGKIATAGYWIGLLCFVLATLLPAGIAHPVLVVAYAITLTALALGIYATISYFLVAFQESRGVLAQTRFDRYVIIRNPVSTDSYKADERIQELKNMQPNSTFIVLDTVADGRDANAAMLRKHADILGPETLLCIAAGDGTIHMILNILLHDQKLPPEARHTPILPLWCGNANDLAYMLNGAYSARRLRKVLSSGDVVRVKPIEVTLTPEGSRPVTYIASSYVSFGATAYITYALEHALPRKSPVRHFLLSRIRLEITAATRALVQAPTFQMTNNSHRRTIFERTYLNGSRFAKFIGIPLKLTDEKFHRVTIEHKHPLDVALRFLGLLNNKEIPKRAITHDAFLIHDEVWAQLDGEPLKLPAETKVEIAVSAKPFYALSVRLQ